jgi:hypothetical protein
MQKLVYLGEIVPVSIWFRMVLTEVKTEKYKKILSPSDIYHQYQYLTGIANLIVKCGISLGQVLYSIIDVFDY